MNCEGRKVAALEKSHNEMRKGLEKGGSVNKELRETVEKSRRDLQSEWERARSELRMAMRDRLSPDEGKSVRKKHKRTRVKMTLPRKKPLRLKKSEQSSRKHAPRFVRLSSNYARRPAGSAKCSGERCSVVARSASAGMSQPPSPDRTPDDQPSKPEASPRSPRSPATPAKPATPASPRRVEPPAAARQPVAPRRPPGDGARGPGSNTNPQYEQRLRNLENKLEELLKEIKKLKEEKKPEESKNSSPRRGRSANPGTPVTF